MGLLMIDAGSSATPTENNPNLPSETPLSNNTENVQVEFLTRSILAIHNQERAAVGVPPLTWNDLIAADAQEYANYLLATGKFEHQGRGRALNGGPNHMALMRTLHISTDQTQIQPRQI